MKFLVVKSIPTPIIIAFEPKYSPEGRVLKYISLVCVPPFIWKIMFHSHGATGNMNASYILIFEFLQRSRKYKYVWTE